MHRLSSQLPLAVHFISQAPQFDIVWFFYAVADSQVAVFRTRRMVAVFQQIARVGGSSCAEIYRHHRVRADFFRPFCELAQSERIRLKTSPRQFQPWFSLVQRTHAVFPEKVGHKVSSGITDNRYIQFFNKVYHVPAESVFIRRGMSRLIYAAVHSPSEMLDKGAVNPLIYRRYFKRLIHDHFCFSHICRIPPVVMASAFYRAGCHTFNKIFLEAQEQHQDRQHREK